MTDNTNTSPSLGWIGGKLLIVGIILVLAGIGLSALDSFRATAVKVAAMESVISDRSLREQAEALLRQR